MRGRKGYLGRQRFLRGKTKDLLFTSLLKSPSFVKSEGKYFPGVGLPSLHKSPSFVKSEGKAEAKKIRTGGCGPSFVT
jgi:hypothetical protein